MQIVDLFYDVARQHKLIRGFAYGKEYEKGAGSEAYPFVWLDDPIYGQSLNDRVIRYTANVDILGIPSKSAEVLAIQSAAFSVGLSFIQKIKGTQSDTGFNVDGFTFLSLRDYYDNNAAGFRFTYTMVQANPVERCTDYFDPSKTFTAVSVLPNFVIEHPDGCAVFNDKTGLPDFKIEV